jgi:hypothetical protein
MSMQIDARVDAGSMFLAIYIRALIAMTISPQKLSVAMKHVPRPLTNILTAIWPSESAFTMSVVLNERTIVSTTVGIDVNTNSMSKTCLELAFVARAIRPCFAAHAMPVVFHPQPDVPESVGMRKSAMSLRQAIQPFPLIDVSFGMSHDAVAARLPATPLAFVLRTV